MVYFDLLVREKYVTFFYKCYLDPSVNKKISASMNAWHVS